MARITIHKANGETVFFDLPAAEAADLVAILNVNTGTDAERVVAESFIGPNDPADIRLVEEG